MSVIEGKIKSSIFYNETNGYFVGLFRVSKVSDDNLKENLKKVITITGNILDLKLETKIILEGEFVLHERFGWQFKFDSYEIPLPNENEDIIEFLSSPFVKGCGKKTAVQIVEIYGAKSLDIIKEDINALDKIEGMNESKKNKIYESILNYSKSSDTILRLKKLGFSIEEAGRIFNKFRSNIDDILNN